MSMPAQPNQPEHGQLVVCASKVDCYNLDAIISVGYRVRSPRGTKFRQRELAVPSQVEKDFEQVLKHLPLPTRRKSTRKNRSASMILKSEKIGVNK